MKVDASINYLTIRYYRIADIPIPAPAGCSGVPTRGKYPGNRQCLSERLQHGLNAGVNGEVRDAGAADEVGLALGVREMQEAAEVVILVEDVEESLDFRGAQLKGGEGNGLAELTRDGEVAIHNFAKAQHRCRTSGMGNRRIIAPQCSAAGQPREARVWRAARDSVRC